MFLVGARGDGERALCPLLPVSIECPFLEEKHGIAKNTKLGYESPSSFGVFQVEEYLGPGFHQYLMFQNIMVELSSFLPGSVATWTRGQGYEHFWAVNLIHWKEPNQSRIFWKYKEFKKESEKNGFRSKTFPSPPPAFLNLRRHCCFPWGWLGGQLTAVDSWSDDTTNPELSELFSTLLGRERTIFIH